MSQDIVQGAQMSCTLGSATAQILVTSQLFVQIENKLVATEEDKLSVINIPPFGTCKRGIFPPPCIPALQNWQNTTLKDNINGYKKLTKESFSICSQGGCVTFMDTGINTFVDSE